MSYIHLITNDIINKSLIWIPVHYTALLATMPQRIVGRSSQGKKRIFLGFIKDLLNTSSIHGFNHIVARKRHPLERIVAFILVIAAFYGVFFLNNLTLSRYFNNPTVISMERDPLSWNTSFPSATICPEKKVNEELLNTFLNSSTDIKNKDLFRKFINSVLNATYYNFEDVIEYENMTGDDLANLFRKFRFNFSPSVSGSALNDHHMVIQESVTEMGFCYSFNSQIAIYNSIQ